MRGKMKMIQLTHWLDPDKEFDSQYGRIKSFEWLLREKNRIDGDISRFAEIRIKNGKSALFVNKVA